MTTSSRQPNITDLDDVAIVRLLALRARIASGKVNEETPETCRLLFARWLYEHGRLNEGLAHIASRPAL